MQVIIVFLEFRALVCIQNIFEYKLMNTEHFSNSFDNINICQSLDNDPGNGITILVFQNLIYRLNAFSTTFSLL